MSRADDSCSFLSFFLFESTIGLFIPNSAVQNAISGSCWGSSCVKQSVLIDYTVVD